MRVKDNNHLEGMFWLPKSSQKIQGKVTISDGGKIELNTKGILSTKVNDDVNYSIIHGIVDGNTPVTLVNNFSILISMDHSKDRIVSNGLFYGYHFFSKEIELNNIRFHIENFYIWFGKSGFKNNLDLINRTGYTIKYELPETTEIKLYDNVTLDIAFKAKGPSYPHISPVTLEEDVYIEIKSTTPKSLSEIQNYIYNTTMFINFMSETICTIYNVSFTHKGHKIKYYYSSLPFSFIEKPCKLHDFMSDRFYIQKNLDKIFPQWFTILKEFSPQIQLLLKARQDFCTGFNEGTFVELTKVAESYHALSEKEKSLKVPKKTYNDFLENLSNYALTMEIASLFNKSDGYTIKNFIKNILSNANGKDFYTRIEELVMSFYEYFLPVNLKDVNTVAKQIRDSRNYYTHFNKKGEGKAVKGIELYKLCNVLFLVMKFEFFKKLNIDDIYIKEKIFSEMTTILLPDYIQRTIEHMANEEINKTVESYLEKEKNK